jgi:hypothetical protein
MAVSTLSPSDPRQPKIYRGGTQVSEFLYGAQLEAATMLFAIGHFVYSNSGAITDAEDSTKILGLAGKAATNVSSGNIQIPVQVILPGDTLLIQVEDGSGTVEASDTTCVVGKSYGIKAFSENVPSRIDSAEVTNEQFIYLGPQLDAAGASTPFGWFCPDLSGAKIQTAEGD